MSRKPAPPLPPGYTRTFAVAVVCTDRGQHAEAGIANVTEAADSGDPPSVMWQQTGHGSPLADWQRADGTRTFVFRCRRCRRELRLREPSLLAVIAALRDAGDAGARPVLDVSLC